MFTGTLHRQPLVNDKKMPGSRMSDDLDLLDEPIIARHIDRIIEEKCRACREQRLRDAWPAEERDNVIPFPSPPPHGPGSLVASQSRLRDRSEDADGLQDQVSETPILQLDSRFKTTDYAIAVGADFFAEPLAFPLYSGSFRLIPDRLSYYVSPYRAFGLSS